MANKRDTFMNYYDDHHHSFDEIVKSVSQNVEESLESLVQLKDLRHLDISQVSKIQSDLFQEKKLSCKSSKTRITTSLPSSAMRLKESSWNLLNSWRGS